jgi:hypothetical protein
MSLYLLRNKDNGKWADSGVFDCDNFYEARRKYNSLEAATKSMKQIIKCHRQYNLRNSCSNLPENYEIVEFSMIPLGVCD